MHPLDEEKTKQSTSKYMTTCLTSLHPFYKILGNVIFMCFIEFFFFFLDESKKLYKTKHQRITPKGTS
jgi:hypothetical protein